MAGTQRPEFDHDVETAIVTGALGDVGSWVVDRLADGGVDVVGLDRDSPDGVRANVECRTIDLTHTADTWETVYEVDPDAVVHLAAISDPGTTPGTRVFENNVSSTHNVLVSAGRAGADIVWTSSQAAYGALFATSAWTPDYLPIDEAHECRPADPYGLSKCCSEDVARAVARRHDVSVTTLRPATVFSPDNERSRPHRDGTDLEAAPRGGDFGSYVDVRDLSRMVEAALASDHDGHETVNCVADENYLGSPTAELVEAICGELPDDCEVSGRAAALSNAKAADLLDWTPEHSWSDGEATDADAPSWT